MNSGFSELTTAVCCGCPGMVLPVCDSTMDVAWSLHKKGRFPEFAWVLARTQTRARGRQGRIWVTGPGDLAVTLRLPDEARKLGPLVSMATALALVRAMADMDVSAAVKWPNDILVHGCKAGGVLIEEKQGVVMAGIGVNLENAPENSGVEHFFHLPAGCLHLSGVGLDLFDIWGRFLQRILDRFPVMTADPATIVREVNAVLAWKNETVVLKDTGSVDGPAVVLEVDGQGRLGVRTRKGVTFIRSGTLYPRVT